MRTVQYYLNKINPLHLILNIRDSSSDYEVKFGSTKLNGSDGDLQVRQITSITSHGDFVSFYWGKRFILLG